MVRDLGMCVALYDVISVGESQLHQGSASQHSAVEFRLVIFAPFVGEILTGTIMSCDEAGLRLSLGFFDEIYVPKALLQAPSSWSGDEKLWVWNVTESDQLFFDIDNMARFRVMDVSYARQLSAPGPLCVEEERPAMSVTAAVDKEGLGLLQWWPGEEEGGVEEEGDWDEEQGE